MDEGGTSPALPPTSNPAKAAKQAKVAKPVKLMMAAKLMKSASTSGKRKMGDMVRERTRYTGLSG